MRSGLPIPEHIQNAPELKIGLGLYMQAFFDLDTTRHDSGPISWLAVREYAAHYGLDAEQEEALFYHIRELDKSHLERLKKKREAETKKAKRPPRKR